MSFNNNFLTLCGGHRGQRFTDRLKRFDLQTLSWDNDAFITRQMRVARSGISCAVIKDPAVTDRSQQMECPLILIGGNTLGSVTSVVEMYSFTDNKSTRLAPMKESRAHCGSAYLPSRNEIVVVGGTGRTNYHDTRGVSRQIEIYNFHKDEWRKCNRRCEMEHAFRPLVWNDEMNNDILYVAGDVMQHGKRDKLGALEVYDMRVPKNWKLVDERDLLGLLELRNSVDIFNDWTARRALVI